MHKSFSGNRFFSFLLLYFTVSKFTHRRDFDVHLATKPPLFSAISLPLLRSNPHRFSAPPPPLYQIRSRLEPTPSRNLQHGRPPDDSCCTRLACPLTPWRIPASRTACTCRRHVFAPSAPFTPRFHDGQRVERHATNSAAQNPWRVLVKSCQDS